MKKSGVTKKGNIKLTATPLEKLKVGAQTIQEIAENSLNHYLEGFRQGGGQTDESKGGWAPRKSGESGRAILVKSGALWRDLDVRNITKDSIVIGTNRIPYAAVHNEGLDVPDIVPRRRKALKFTIGGKTYFRKRVKGFRMPKREFLGHSTELNRKNLDIIKDYFKTILTGK